jgi:catalase-peroxidase
VLGTLEKIQQGLQRRQSGGKKVSLADLIVLGGCAAVEKGAKEAGVNVRALHARGAPTRRPEQTDAESFAPLEPKADGFRNYLAKGETVPPSTCWWTRPSC